MTSPTATPPLLPLARSDRERKPAMTRPRQSSPWSARVLGRRSLMVLAAFVLTAGGIVGTWRSLSSGEQAGSAAAPAYCWQPGQRLVYRLEHVSAGALEQEALPDKPLAQGADEPTWASLGAELV